jgi:hypothetical protein
MIILQLSIAYISSTCIIGLVWDNIVITNGVWEVRNEMIVAVFEVLCRDSYWD